MARKFESSVEKRTAEAGAVLCKIIERFVTGTLLSCGLFSYIIVSLSLASRIVVVNGGADFRVSSVSKSMICSWRGTAVMIRRHSDSSLGIINYLIADGDKE